MDERRGKGTLKSAVHVLATCAPPFIRAQEVSTPRIHSSNNVRCIDRAESFLYVTQSAAIFLKLHHRESLSDAVVPFEEDECVSEW